MKKFPGTFEQFATIASLIIGSYEELLALFMLVSPKNNPSFVILLRSALQAAQEMPDVHSRRAANNKLGQQLLTQHTLMRKQFQLLQGYIQVAFPTNTKEQWILAGLQHFRKGKNKKWSSTIQMAINMETYIAANLAALLLNNNMPPNFEANFLLKKATFIAKHTEYMQARQDTLLATKAKIAAFNALYDQLNLICKQAKLLDLDEIILDQFNFSKLLKMVKGTRRSGVQGDMTYFPSGKPASYAYLKFDNGKIIRADKNGKYKVILEKGDHHGTAFAPDSNPPSPYLPQPFLFPVEKGTMSTMNIQLIQ